MSTVPSRSSFLRPPPAAEHPSSRREPWRLLFEDCLIAVPLCLMQGASFGFFGGLLLGGPLGWMLGHGYWHGVLAAALILGPCGFGLLLRKALRPACIQGVDR